MREQLEKPKISVIIPSFNQAAYLEKAIDSILSQQWPALELIIVDGGSTDGSMEILERFSDDLAWWVSEPDRGQGHAINKGFGKCSGDLVSFIGSDDLYLPGAMSDAASLYLENPDCGAVVGGFVRINDVDEVVSPVVPSKYSWSGPMDLMHARPGSWRLHQVSTFYSRSALDEVGKYVDEKLRYALDRELLNRICREFRIVTSCTVYAAFRHHDSSKSVSEILPFCRELAELHLRDIPLGESAPLRRRRRALSRRQLGSGYLKLARAEGRGYRAISALLKVPIVSPRLSFSRPYVVRWLEVLGMAAPIRRLLGRPDPNEIAAKPLSEVVNEL